MKPRYIATRLFYQIPACHGRRPVRGLDVLPERTVVASTTTRRFHSLRPNVNAIAAAAGQASIPPSEAVDTTRDPQTEDHPIQYEFARKAVPS
jgi:hypothetical protein